MCVGFFFFFLFPIWEICSHKTWAQLLCGIHWGHSLRVRAVVNFLSNNGCVCSPQGVKAEASALSFLFLFLIHLHSRASRNSPPTPSEKLFCFCGLPELHLCRLSGISGCIGTIQWHIMDYLTRTGIVGLFEQ